MCLLLRRLAIVASTVALFRATGLAAAQAPAASAAVQAAMKAQPASAAQVVTDVFMGQGAVGPYVLSWANIEAGSVVVTRDGRRLQREADYRVDPAAGVITFTAPLRPRQIARVDYAAVTGKAKANAKSLIAPMQFSLFQAEHGAVNLQALYKPGITGAGSTAGLSALTGAMMLSFAGNARLTDASSLTSRIYLDGRGGNLLNRGALQVAETNKLRAGQVDLSYTRAGAGFTAGDETGLTAGRELLTAAVKLNPIHGFAASASFQQATELLEAGEGATVTTVGQRLSGAVGQGGKLQLAHTDTFTHAEDGERTARSVDRVQVDQALGDRTKATATVERTEISAGGDRTVTQTNKLTVRTQPTDRVQVEGSFRNSLLASGPQDAASVRVNADATDRITLGAEAGETYSRSGAVHNRAATVNYRTGRTLTLDGSVLLRGDAASDAYTGSLGATARAGRYVELSGRFKGRQVAMEGAPDPDALNTVEMRAALALPGTRVKVTGGFADNPEADGGAVERARSHNVGLSSALGRFDVSGAYTRREDMTGARTDSTFDLRVGWRLGGGTTLTTGYREVLAIQSDVLATDTFSFGFSHRVGSALDLTLGSSLTRYVRDGVLQPNHELRAEAKVGVRF